MTQTIVNKDYLRRNSALNPVLWDGDRLRPDVRTHLLNFAEAFRRFAKIPEGAVRDVYMVGGNTGLYYNDLSDVDVHLVIDRSALGAGDLTDEYLRDKKALWTLRHDVRVKGYQVEPYAQDTSDPLVPGQGVYSVQRGEWVQRPIETDYDPSTDPILRTRADSWRRSIDKLLSNPSSVDDLETVRRRLADMRSRSISRGGELGRDNLVFKSLRNTGHLDRITNHIRRMTSDSLSLA